MRDQIASYYKLDSSFRNSWQNTSHPIPPTHTPTLLFHQLPSFHPLNLRLKSISSNKTFLASQLEYFFLLCISLTMTFATVHSLLNSQSSLTRLYVFSDRAHLSVLLVVISLEA